MKVRDEQGNVVAVLSMVADLHEFYREWGKDPNTHSVEYSPQELRLMARRGIYTVADLPSLLGVTSDMAAINGHAMATLLGALQSATSVEELRAAMSPFTAPYVQYAEALDSGEAKMPYIEKGGLEVIMPEIQEVGTRVAQYFTTEQASP
ncbi:MAG: hypothetical protein ETSY1_46845 (plasmid) [Candidatus Entotheonella factor]|uniref:Uncharacterized protein n=1 Tax=Entotheonella factor TaxID=1429438 RepID=W4M0B5_ENTF1|nr:MAG: hypothetical protein ETSY1_46845 [Candidatus Entotheonella factor]